MKRAGGRAGGRADIILELVSAVAAPSDATVPTTRTVISGQHRHRPRTGEQGGGGVRLGKDLQPRG